MSDPRRRDLARTALVALVARLVVVAIAWNRFPPADDGVLYDTLARRLAHGLGYTWAWPDEFVTHVAHYPVGYPVLLAIAYRVLGERPASALVLNALIGSAGAVCVHYVASWGMSLRAGRWAGLAVALHPALLAYTPAIMTEGVCSAMLTVPFALALLTREARARGGAWFGLLAAGVALGIAVLVRPQAILVAPLVAWLACPAAHSPVRRLAAVALIVAGTLAVVAPWTARNQRAFGRPVWVSANSGWNLLIGTDADGHGGWRQLEPPPECRQVWDEAAKDACFGDAARQRIRASPGAWLQLVPAKLAATFDLGGSGVSYLSRARPDLVSRWCVLAAGAAETLFERLVVLAALLTLGLEEGTRRRARLATGLVASVFLVTRYAWPAYVGLALVLCLGSRVRLREQPVRAVTAAVLVATIVTHALFFGAGRYALLVLPWVAALGVAVVADRRVASMPAGSPSTS